MKREHDDDCAITRGDQCDCVAEEESTVEKVTSVEILCQHCYGRLIITEQAPRITKGMTGGIPYTQVRVDCQLCGKETKVPQNEETKALLKKRLEELSLKIYPYIYNDADKKE